MIAPATMVCFGYERLGAACPTPHAIAYVSRCERVACETCVRRACTLIGPAFKVFCNGCGARWHTEADMWAHWRPIAGAA